jgi:hypothetical protein
MDTASTSKPQDSAVPGADWPATITAEFATNEYNPRVGTRLLSTSDRVRVWEIRLNPGERIGFHRHVLDNPEFLQSANSLLPPGRNGREHRLNICYRAKAALVAYTGFHRRPISSHSRPKILPRLGAARIKACRSRLSAAGNAPHTRMGISHIQF